MPLYKVLYTPFDFQRKNPHPLILLAILIFIAILVNLYIAGTVFLQILTSMSVPAVKELNKL